MTHFFQQNSPIHLKITFYLFTLSFIFSSCEVHKKQELIDFTGNATQDIEKFFPNKVVTANIMSAVSQNKEMVTLTNKFKQGIQQNGEWFFEYIKDVPEGEPMPYHPNLGLTKKEYDKLQDYLENIKMKSSGRELITINNTDSLISFDGQGRLEILDNLTIDVHKNKVYYKDYVLDYDRYINIEDNSNALASSWRGYSWQFTTIEDADEINPSTLQNLDLIQVQFTLGQLEKDGRTYLNLKEKVIKFGVPIENNELALLF